jgi:hypothetical protein
MAHPGSQRSRPDKGTDGRETGGTGEKSVTGEKEDDSSFPELRTQNFVLRTSHLSRS